MIRLHQIQFGYGSAPLLRNLDFVVEPGSVCGLLGQNGVGKTTLMKIISGLRFAQAGEVEVVGFNPAERRPQFLSQVFYLPEIVALPNLRPAAYLQSVAPFYPAFDHALFRQYTEEFSLPMDRPLNQLSLGESRKVMLAFALAAGCRLLLLDEPANGLDIPSRKQLRRLLAMGVRDDRAVIISTHHVHDIEALVDSVAIFHGGGIVLHQSIAALTRRLIVSSQGEPPNPESVLYSERSAGGYTVLRELRDEPESALDLEMLFQAVMADPNRVRAIFGRTKGEPCALC